jgi:hypothetical protein
VPLAGFLLLDDPAIELGDVLSDEPSPLVERGLH